MNIKPIFFLLFIFAIACGDSDTGSNNGTGDNNGGGGNNGDSDGTAVPLVLCQARCVTKASDCGTEPEPASIFCREEICNLTPNEGELKCLEAKTCDAVEAVVSSPTGDFCGLDLG